MPVNCSRDCAQADQRIIRCGTYDLGKPRTRLMRAALIDAGYQLEEVHADVWAGVEDKSQITSRLARFYQATRLISAYPLLIWRYLRAPKHDIVIIPYLGHSDMLIVGALARLLGKPVVWDAFLSLYDTVVLDRAMVSPHSLVAKVLFAWERLACRIASLIVLDTATHAQLFEELYKVPPDKLRHAYVGAEAQFTKPLPDLANPSGAEFNVLFYGQFIPLHGIDTIFAAAQMCRDPTIRWTIIGTGQEAPRIRGSLGKATTIALEWIEWVPYDELADRIAQADLCLGIFGTSGKASRVIPNKVFQILAAQKPLVTRDSPAMRELLPEGGSSQIMLVPPGDPVALLAAIEAMRGQSQNETDDHPPDLIAARFDRAELARQWSAIVTAALEDKPVG